MISEATAGSRPWALAMFSASEVPIMSTPSSMLLHILPT